MSLLCSGPENEMQSPDCAKIAIVGDIIDRFEVVDPACLYRFLHDQPATQGLGSEQFAQATATGSQVLGAQLLASAGPIGGFSCDREPTRPRGSNVSTCPLEAARDHAPQRKKAVSATSLASMPAASARGNRPRRETTTLAPIKVLYGRVFRKLLSWLRPKA